MEMEKKVLFQRMKGLLALVLAFTIMFGTGMRVLADEAKEIDYEDITVGANIPGGTTLFHSYSISGSIYVYIYDDENKDKIDEDFSNRKNTYQDPIYCVKTLKETRGTRISVTLPGGYTYSVEKNWGGEMNFGC